MYLKKKDLRNYLRKLKWISSKEKLKEENNGNENIKSDKRNKELKHELSSLFPKADDNDTVIDVEIKNENDNDVKINIQEKKEN